MTKTTFAAIAALALAATAGTANAAVKASGTVNNNFSFTTPTAAVPVNGGATSLTVTNTKATKLIITYSAECAVDAPASNTTAWVDIDLNLNGVAIAPTAGTLDAFCSANGSASFDAWNRASITTVVTAPAGVSTITVTGRLNNGATGGWLSDSALVVQN